MSLVSGGETFEAKRRPIIELGADFTADSNNSDRSNTERWSVV